MSESFADQFRQWTHPHQHPEERRPRSPDEILALMFERFETTMSKLDDAIAANTAATGNMTTALAALTSLSQSAAPTDEQIAALTANASAVQALADQANATVAAANPPAVEPEPEVAPVEEPAA